MMGNYRRELVTCAEEDRISNIPEKLIGSILERLPVQDAVRTSIISKKWKYKWTTMRALVFDDQFFKKYVKNGAFGHIGFISIINKVLILHKGPISKFLLHIPNIYIFWDSFEEVNQWMLFLSRNGVKELILANSGYCYELPSYLFSCLELTKLELENCLFKPPLEFKGFINLKDVDFLYVDFSANLCGTQINLPQLKSLCLDTCTNVHNFNIKATKLWCLQVFDCPDAMFLCLFRSSPCLTTVSLFLRKPIGKFVPTERMTLDMMLSNLPEITGLLFNGLFFKALIAEKIPKWLPHPVNTLRILCFPNFKLGDMNQLDGALCLLRNSPNLERLYFDWHQLMEPQDILYDVGPFSDHLESPNCLDCTLSKLHTVEITSLQGSRSELLFIKLLLSHSPSLKKLAITPTGNCDAKNLLNIVKELMRFPRASPKAEIIYLDPIP